MPDLSPILALPFIQPAQAQKHVTHNEALMRLDLLVQTVVAARNLTLPPAAPPEGTCHIVGPAATGAWAGRDNALAVFLGDGWQFITPQPGWSAHVLAEAASVTYSGTAWVAAADLPLRVARLGIATDADATNRLAVSAPATLLSHAGAGHQVKVNKASAADTASLLFQSGWSGRAEMGLAGTDSFAVKVSADGTAFTTALQITPATGLVSLPQGASIAGPLTGTAITQTATDTTAGRVTKVGDFGLGGEVNHSSTADYNALMTGFIGNAATTSVPANAPGAAAESFSGVVARSSATRAMQLLARTRSDRLYFRRQDSTWGAWREIFHQASILGTVAQAAGIPTGAVIERGSNANGGYVRFADGTQICQITEGGTLTCDTAVGGLFASPAEGTWTFPAAFVNASEVVVGAGVLVNGRWVNARRGSSTSAVFRHYAATSSPTSQQTSLWATGRWF